MLVQKFILRTKFLILLHKNKKKMRAIIQRVNYASVKVANETIGKIDKGFLIFIGFEDADNEEDISWLSSKIINLRIFNDSFGKMNLSLKDVDGNILLVSQFTLHASTKKGNRPSFINAAKPYYAHEMYEKFTNKLTDDFGKQLQTGKFGADMKILLENDGPVTIIIDTKNKE